MALNELADLLYEAAKDIESLAREFVWAGGDASEKSSGKGDPMFLNVGALSTVRRNKLREIGLPVLEAMKWNEHKLEALRHALAIEQATQ